MSVSASSRPRGRISSKAFGYATPLPADELRDGSRTPPRRSAPPRRAGSAPVAAASRRLTAAQDRCSDEFRRMEASVRLRRTNMARAIWSGSISFGLLNVPVKLYSAASKQTIRFKELRERDGSRVRHKRVAEDDGKEVPYDDIVKGYEFAPDQYVTLTRDELSELDPKKTRAIEIQDFVDLDDIDPIYFEHALLPRPRQGRREGLRAAGRGDEGRAQGRDRPLRAAQQGAPRRDPPDGRRADDGDDALPRRGHRARATSTTCFAEDKPGKPDKRELEMAKKLIESLSTDFKADKYRDEYREELLDAARAQGRGQGDRQRPERGAGADQGARPDGRARGEPRGRPRRARSAGEAQASNGAKAKSKPKPKAKSSRRAARAEDRQAEEHRSRAKARLAASKSR